MDELLKGNYHVNKITSQLFTCLRDIRSIRHQINQETAKIIIQALILSKFDYCSSLLAGAAQYQLDKLQRIQNMACKIIHHITSDMMSLHWLCIWERITYKIPTMMYSINSFIAPKYLQDLVHKQTHERRLRSSVSDSFHHQGVKQVPIKQAFSVQLDLKCRTVYQKMCKDPITGILQKETQNTIVPPIIYGQKLTPSAITCIIQTLSQFYSILQSSHCPIVLCKVLLKWPSQS